MLTFTNLPVSTLDLIDHFSTILSVYELFNDDVLLKSIWQGY